MSVTPGPWATPPRTANGRAAAVPSGKTVSRWPRRSARGRPARPEDGLDRVAEDAGRVRVAGHLAAEAGQVPGRPGRHLVHAVARVAPAVDVDEALELGPEGRLGGGDAGSQGIELAGLEGDDGGRHPPSLGRGSRVACAPERPVAEQ